MGRWAHLMTDTVTVAPRTGFGAGGSTDSTYGAQTTVAARVEQKTQLVRTPEGNELQSNTVVASETEIASTSKLWLPGDDTGGQHRRIVATSKASIPGGATLYEAYL